MASDKCARKKETRSRSENSQREELGGFVGQKTGLRPEEQKLAGGKISRGREKFRASKREGEDAGASRNAKESFTLF